MRRRRSQLGLTAPDAQRAGISTSYVSLIENGAKVPEENVAAGIARALDDDEALYRAWARAARLGIHDLALLNELEAISQMPAYRTLVESGEELPRLEARRAGRGGDSGRPGSPAARGGLAPRVRPSQYGAGPHATGRRRRAGTPSSIPVLAAGPTGCRQAPGPPRRGSALSTAASSTSTTRSSSSPARSARRSTCGGAAGDRVVFRRGGAVSPDRICAVRTGQGIVLARVLVQERSLLLLPGEGETSFESVGLPEPGELSDVVVGTHVVLIRR
jgi:transcriptional regulator with XRE-family HTH domain